MDFTAFIKKINDFISKYYLNQIVRGSIWLCAFFLFAYIILITAEYFSYFNPFVKTILFYLFITIQLGLFIFLILKPLIAYLKIGKTIDHEAAGEIIGKHFPEIKDKITNTLQLQKTLLEQPKHQELILAGINQKVAQMQPIPFVSAIKISENKKYIRFAVFPIIIILILSLFWPNLLTEGTTRIIQHDKKFERKAPFSFNIENKNLKVSQGEDFLLKLKLVGDKIPQEVFIEIDQNTFQVKKENIINFSYLFKNVQKNINFRFKAGQFFSEEQSLKVVKKPNLITVNASITYPKYLNKPNESMVNPGDLNLPEGSTINWNLKTENTDQILIKEADRSTSLKPIKKDEFNFIYTAKNTASILFQPINKNVKQQQITYQINVIKDAYPSINVEEKIDSLNKNAIYLMGNAADDYGISSLSFIYAVVKSSEKNRINKVFKTPIKIDINKNNISFFYFWSINKTGILPGEEIAYHFEVKDNDGVNGSKTTKSDQKYLKQETKEQSQQKVSENTAAVKNKIAEATKQAAKIQQEAQKLYQDLFNNKSLDFEQQRKIEDVLQKQQQLDQLLKEIKNDNQKNLLDRKELLENKELLEKQEKIQDLFDNVLDQKTKELLKNLQKLLDEKSKNMSPTDMQQMQVENKSLQKELDRILELYKKLEIEQKINQSIDKLKDLAQKQDQNKAEKNASKQDAINKSFEEIKKELADAKSKNELLDRPENIDTKESLQSKIDKKLKDALESLKKNKEAKASQEQKEASEQMQELASNLESMMMEGEEEENELNKNALRQILQNLLKSSFDQEKIMIEIKKTNADDPRLIDLGKKQREIKDNLKIVEDSLLILGKKIPEISSTVSTEIEQINSQVNNSIINLTERKLAEVNKNQQYTLTSINNLSLIISEILDKLQDKQKKGSSGSKGKPKSGMSQLSKMQEQLNKNMQNAREKMQQQGINQGQQGKNSMSKDFSEMAREQQMIRQALQELAQKMGKDGNGNKGNFEKIIKEMEQTETELLNKRIQQESIERQKNIQTKLLEAEKAEREKEEDFQKESKSGKEFAPNYNQVLKEYLKQKDKEVEILKTVPPSLNNFYKNKFNDYLKLIKAGD